MEHMGDRAKNPVQAAQTTLRIVEALKELNGAGITEVSDHLGLPKSSVHNYLSTLQQEGYVVKEDRTYRVGLRFLEFGAFARHHRKVYEVAKPEVTDLAKETGELVNLATLEHGMVVYLYRERGANAVKVDAYTGHRVHCHNTALGKAMLAQLPDAQVDRIIDYHGMPAVSANSITDRDELYADLRRIRTEGVAFDREERLSGLRCIAAPIVSKVGGVEGAVSISGPTSRMKGDRFTEELPELIKNASNVIELNVTYS